jgi:hypothetical protein
VSVADSGCDSYSDSGKDTDSDTDSGKDTDSDTDSGCDTDISPLRVQLQLTESKLKSLYANKLK